MIQETIIKWPIHKGVHSAASTLLYMATENRLTAFIYAGGIR